MLADQDLKSDNQYAQVRVGACSWELSHCKELQEGLMEESLALGAAETCPMEDAESSPLADSSGSKRKAPLG